LIVETRLGGKLRRLRQERKLTQAQMAQQLEISASYLNLLEHNQRPVTVPVLLKLAQRFSIDIDVFNTDDEPRLLSSLMEAFSDPLFDVHGIKAAELKELVTMSPALARALLTLYQATRGTQSQSRAPAGTADSKADGEFIELPSGMPSEEVSDFIDRHGNYFHVLELAAEKLWAEHNLSLNNLYQGLVAVLATQFAVDVTVLPIETMENTLREYRPLQRQLRLSEILPLPSRCFQLAHQIALLGWHGEINGLAAQGKFTTEESDMLARSALANYFAAAVMMPYKRFHEAARTTRHDLDILQHRFGASFEQVCHRLTTLRRPDAEGLPFHLIRVDIAGNISKRFSGSGIHIARFGAACPRWNVYDAFSTPGMLRVQVSQMPDGANFFCVARTVTPAGRQARSRPFGPRVTQLAIGLGCPLSHARQIAYADGLALDDPQIATPIGVSCRICERTDCADRAIPSQHYKLEVDENRRGLSPYAGPSAAVRT
jgi:predicted transcriptional regulator/transcriptional regulator with XRE-family HTH domain